MKYWLVKKASLQGTHAVLFIGLELDKCHILLINKDIIDNMS